MKKFVLKKFVWCEEKVYFEVIEMYKQNLNPRIKYLMSTTGKSLFIYLLVQY